MSFPTGQIHTIRVGASAPLRAGPGPTREQLQLSQLHLVLHRLADAAGMRLPAQVRADVAEEGDKYDRAPR